VNHDRHSSRMLKQSASGVLAALRGSPYRSVRRASSLAAALLDGLFAHPAGYPPRVPDVRTNEVLACLHCFSAACRLMVLISWPWGYQSLARSYIWRAQVTMDRTSP